MALRSDDEETQVEQTSSIAQDSSVKTTDQVVAATESTKTTQEITVLGQDATVTEATETISVTDATTAQTVTEPATDLETFTRSGDEQAPADISTTEETSSTTLARVDNVPQPELVKEGRYQDISKPTENLFRPLVIRPSGVKPKPSKVDDKFPVKFNINPPVNSQPQFFPRPHFPPPSFFSPQQQFNGNLGQVSPYSTGFSLPILPEQNPLQPQEFLPPQPHPHQPLIHNQQPQLAINDELLEQQVVHPLPTPESTDTENEAPVEVFSPVAVAPAAVVSPVIISQPAVASIPVSAVENPVAVSGNAETVAQADTFIAPQLPQSLPAQNVVANQSPVQERKLTQQNSVLLPEQSLQAAEPPQFQQVPVSVPAGTQPLVPQAIPTHFPPPHNICYYEGLHPDPHRCPIFHECIYENHEWKVYTWRCPRGKYYDSELQNCVAGYC